MSSGAAVSIGEVTDAEHGATGRRCVRLDTKIKMRSGLTAAEVVA